MESSTYLAPLDRLFELVLVTTIVCVVFCVGRRVTSLLRLQFLGAAEEIAFSVMLGTGITGILIFGLGIAHLLTPVPVTALFVVLIAFSGRELPKLVEAVSRGVAVVRELRGTMAYLYVLLAALLVVVYVEAAVPPWTHDELIYHLPVTKTFVEHGRIFPLYDNSLGNMPFLIQMVYAVCLMAKADIATRLFSLALTLTTALSLYAFAVRFIDRNTALLAVVTFLAGAMVIEVGVTARVDVSLAGMLFLTTYAVIIYLTTGERKWLYIAGLFAGFSVGIKLTALAWLPPLAVMLVFAHTTQGFKRSRNDLLRFVAMAAIIASPWFVKNLLWFNNPVYPFLTGEVASSESGPPHYFDEQAEHQMNAQFVVCKAENPEHVATLEKTLAQDAALRPARHPLRFWDYYTRPGSYFLGDYRHYPNYGFLLVPLYLFVPRKKWLTWLLVLSAVFYFMIASRTWIARFLLPMFPCLSLVSAYTLTVLKERLSLVTSWLAGLHLYLLAACIGVPLAVSIANVSLMHNLSFLTGKESRREFLSTMDYESSIEFANEHLPRQSRVMLVGLQMGYHLERDYLADETWDTTEWRRVLARNTSMAELNQDLKRQGITHIIYAPELFRFAVRTGRHGSGGVEYIAHDASGESNPDYVVLRNWATFDCYSQKYLDPVYKDPTGQTIFRLKD